MLMTDQVRLASQLEAEFTLAPRSFSFSLSPHFLLTHPSPYFFSLFQHPFILQFNVYEIERES